MKAIVCVVAVLFSTLTANAQTEMPVTSQSYVGMWKIILAVSGLKAQPRTTYLQLLPDSTFIWGIDSANIDPMQGVSRGKWAVGPQAQLIFYSHTQYGDYNNYYEHQSGWLYVLRGHMDGDKKSPEIRLETDTYIEKLNESH